MPDSTEIPKADPFALSEEEKTAYNKAIAKAGNEINHLISVWRQMFGNIPSGQGCDQITYVTKQVLSWRNPPATIDEVHNSRNLRSLLDSAPMAALQIFNVFLSYIYATSSVSKIQQKLVSQIK